MKKYIFLISMICSNWLFAQQESQFTNFMNTKLVYNPAYSGSRGVPSISGIYRQQWMGFDGAPKSMLLSFDAPFNKSRIGLGINAFNRQIGIFNQFYGSMAYSYALINTDDLNFRIGIQGAMRYYSMNFNNADAFVPDVNDQSLSTTNANKLTGNFGLGAYLSYKGWYVGASIPTLINSSFSLNNNFDILRAEEYLHGYLMAGAFLPIGDKFHIKPQGMIKYAQNAPIGLDANLSFTYDYKVTFGASYRSGTIVTRGESLDALLFLQLNKIGIGAAYDFPLGDLMNTNTGSFEVMLRYDFGDAKNGGGGAGSKLTNPRFFF